MRVRDFCVCVCVCVFNIICWNRLLDLKMISYIHDVIKINVVENVENVRVKSLVFFFLIHFLQIKT